MTHLPLLSGPDTPSLLHSSLTYPWSPPSLCSLHFSQKIEKKFLVSHSLCSFMLSIFLFQNALALRLTVSISKQNSYIISYVMNLTPDILRNISNISPFFTFKHKTHPYSIGAFTIPLSIPYFVPSDNDLSKLVYILTYNAIAS